MQENNQHNKNVKRNTAQQKKAKQVNLSSVFNSLGAKKYLVIILAAIMLSLIIGYALVHDKIPEKKIVSHSEAAAPVEANTMLSPEQIAQLNEDATKAADVKKDDGNKDKKEGTTARMMAKIVSPTDEKDWFLAIISTTYPLPEKYTPSLSPVIDGSSINVDSRIAGKYKEMYNAAKAADCILTPYSGYLSYSLQKSTYERKVNFYLNQGMSQKDAESKASLNVLPAGCSEHNAGLAVDIVSARDDFENTKEFQWLCDHAHEYGFILRYPKDKTEITGVSYEPWHWRYVGVEAAEKMVEKNECLEEYLGIV